MAYINKSDASGEPEKGAGTGCVFCDKARSSDPSRDLIVRKGESAYVLMNIFPYNTGHLMVVPYEHVARYDLLDLSTITETGQLAQQAIRAIQRALNPQGFNMGINQGAAAGAGIAAHLHMHIVPRWEGDANFMPVFGDVKVMPESLENTYRKVVEAWND